MKINKIQRNSKVEKLFCNRSSVKNQQIDYNLNFNYDSTGCKGITKNEHLLL
ncbi:hypothetical protein MSIBF_A1910025 [groundwater metagenome]|uniref:Uncharacterized protein n=1 Tax=groundwater metagenome TaxID=717931 RepID=A0A098E991_9ZZZZ